MSKTESHREALTDGAGRLVLTYVRTTRDGLEAADLVEPSPGMPLRQVADAAVSPFAGWAVSAPPELGRILVDLGATTLRHAHWLARDLVEDPPNPAWADLVPAMPGLRVAPASMDPWAYLDAVIAAYPPDHLDFEVRATPAERVAEDLAPLLDGTYGPLLAASGTVQRTSVGDVPGEVVATCLVTDRAPAGPWVVDVFRRPEPDYAGLGSLLLRRALALLAQGGWPTLGLSVTEGNPARATYDRLGFRPVLESLTVRLPD